MTSHASRHSPLLPLTLLVVAAPPLAAQCTTQWLGNSVVPGTNGVVNAATTWDPDGAGPLPPGVVLGGQFQTAGATAANNIAFFDPSSGACSALGSGLSGAVRALAVLPNGELVAGGLVGVVTAPCIARWNGASWAPLGSGLANSSFPPMVFALAVMPNGDLVAGGNFTSAGGISAPRVARWNGVNWSALGSGTNSDVFALLPLPNGDLVAGGTFTTAGGVSASCVARWDGTTWSGFGTGIFGSLGFPTLATVSALARRPNGEIVAGGLFTLGFGSPRGVARWNGSSWVPLGSGVFGANALTVLPDGNLLVAGFFSTAGGVSASNIARWNGSSWSALGAGTNGSIFSLAPSPSGDIVVGGTFTSAGGSFCTNVGRWTTTCPAIATPFGANCAGSGGANVLAATSLPWAGSSFTAVATGMPANALALSVVGFSTVALPLTAVLPQGVVGCTLWVNPDLLAVRAPSAGSVTTQVAIPNIVALAGQQLHEQVVSLELDALGNIVALTGTNGLTATIGTF